MKTQRVIVFSVTLGSPDGISDDAIAPVVHSLTAFGEAMAGLPVTEDVTLTVDGEQVTR